MKMSSGMKRLILLSLLLVGDTDAESYECVHKSEGSHCASPNAPGGLLPQETPQFIVLTFDDALGRTQYDFIEKVLGYGHKNPNDSPIPATFYTTNDNTDYLLAQNLHARGSEIAVHTMTHQTSTDTDYDTWQAEILGCKEALVSLAQIPANEIVGFRAPYLQYNDASFQVLHDNGFLYDASMTEKRSSKLTDADDGTSFIWPYTFDNLGAQDHNVGHPPEHEYPGLWEIPSKF